MAEAQASDIRDLLRAGLSTAAALAVAGLAGVVFERLGAPGTVIAGLATLLVLVVVAVAGLTGGTMRLPVFLTAGRSMSVAALGLAIGASATTAFGGGPFVTAAGIAVGGLLLAPSLRGAGVPGLAGWLGHRFGDPMVRMLAALCVAAVALLFAAGRLGDIGTALGAGLGLSRPVAVALAAGACALVLLPGGLRGSLRAALCAALVALAALPVASSAGAIAAAASQGLPGPLDAAWVAAAAAVMVSPQVAQSISACRTPQDARLALLLGACVTAFFGIGLAAGQSPGGVFPAVGAVALRLSLDMAAAIALLCAAGAALGFELRGPLDRRRHPMSKRFAALRATMALCIIGAAWLATQDAGRLAAIREVATAVLVAGAGPALLIGVMIPRAGRWGGLLACVGGLATVGLLLEGRLAPGMDPAGATLAGLAAGLVAGLVPTLLMRGSPRLPPVDDASL